MSDDDRHLIERARQGEAAAVAELYDRNYEPVYRYCYYRVGDVASAEDLTSEVFVRMVENLDSFDSRGHPLLAWLYVIARNLITDTFRQNSSADRPLDDELVAEDTLMHQVERRLIAKDIVAAFADLTEEQRQVILLKFMQDYDNAEIARIMGKSEGSVKALQHRALAALRRILKVGHEHE